MLAKWAWWSGKLYSPAPSLCTCGWSMLRMLYAGGLAMQDVNLAERCIACPHVGNELFSCRSW